MIAVSLPVPPVIPSPTDGAQIPEAPAEGWQATVEQAIAIAQMVPVPVWAGCIVNVVMTQAIEAWDHILPRWMLRKGTEEISKAAAITLACGIQLILFPAFCWMAHWDVRGEMFVQGQIGSALAIAIGALLDWKGWTLERVFGQDQRAAPTPPTSPG